MALEMYIVDKAKAMARTLATNLALTGVPVAGEELTDKGFPVLKLGSSGAYQWLLIETDFAESEAEGMVNSLGLPQAVYAPHVAKLFSEDFATSSAGQVLTTGKILAQLGQFGTKIELWTGTGVESAADFDAVLALPPTKDATIPSDPINPLTQQM